MIFNAARRYRKKPVVVEAMLLTASNINEVARWCGGRVDGRIVEQSIYGSSYQDLRSLSIPTLEGVMRADIGDYVIKGIHGEFYPCKPDIFAKTYEEES